MTSPILHYPLLIMVIITMTNREKDMFNGHLLGDASIINTNVNKNKQFSFVICSKYFEYINWISSQMDLLHNRPIWKRNVFDKRTKKTYSSNWIRSLSSKELTAERKRWYPDNKKIIPRDLTLSKYTLLNWFLDDGSLATTGGTYLATDCFSKEDLDFVSKLLKDTFNLNNTFHKNGKGHRIYFSKKVSNKFFEIIGECPVECFQYKWDR